MSAQSENELYDRMVRDAMERLGFGRKKAESLAKKMIVRFRKIGVIQDPNSGSRRTARTTWARKAKGPRGKLTPGQIAKLPPVVPPRPPPRNAKERMERALGPDEGERSRRGGSPFVQGGSPGLGKRR